MPAPLTAGTRIADRFELEAPNADLGLGEVWSATDRGGSLGSVTVSLLGPPSPDGPGSCAAFESTVSRLRALSNPGLSTVLAGGQNDNTLWVVTDRLDGRTLANWLEGWRQIGARPTFGAVQRIIDKLCTVLEFAHGAGGSPMVHRGLNPRSVLLRRTGPGPHQVKVTDLGLAPFAFTHGGAARQWAWMAPEQTPPLGASPRWNDGPATDVFSLAVLTVELLTLSALPAPDARETWAARARQPGSDLAAAIIALRQDLPRAVVDVLARALSASAKARPTSAQQLQRSLREAWQSSGEWDRSGANDQDPPLPSAVPPPPRPEPGPQALSGAISGWHSAERIVQPSAAPAPQLYAATIPIPPRQFVTEPSQQTVAHEPRSIAPTTPAPTRKDPTEHVDLGAAGLWHEPQTPATFEGTQALDLSVAQALFGEALPDNAITDEPPEAGTLVMSSPLDAQPSALVAHGTHDIRDVRDVRDVREETRAIDLETALDEAPGAVNPLRSIAGESDPFANATGYSPLTTLSPQRWPQPPVPSHPFDAAETLGLRASSPQNFDAAETLGVRASVSHGFASSQLTPEHYGYGTATQDSRAGGPIDPPMPTMAMPIWQSPVSPQPTVFTPQPAPSPPAVETPTTPRWMIFTALALTLVILAAASFLFLRLH